MLRHALLIAVTTMAVGGAITGTTMAGTDARAQPGSGTLAADPAATAPSTPEQLALSAHLSRRRAIFYGAWWCPACTAQKNLFGKEGGAQLPYVECDKGTEGRQRCMAARVRAYPTWDLDGKRLEGVQSVETLKQWSGFEDGRTQAK
jgi:hypothetical protein